MARWCTVLFQARFVCNDTFASIVQIFIVSSFAPRHHRVIRMIRLLCLTLLFSGCIAPANPERAAAAEKLSSGQVILLRGAYFGVFSTGLDKIAAELRDKGITASVWPWHRWRTIAEEIPVSRAGSPIVLVGHSFGADAAVHLARELRQIGGTVDLIITLDPVFPPPSPSSVGSHWNVYQASPGLAPPWFKGRVIQAECKDRSQVDNLNLWTDGKDLTERRLSHWNLTEHPRLQWAVVRRILTTFRKSHD